MVRLLFVFALATLGASCANNSPELRLATAPAARTPAPAGAPIAPQPEPLPHSIVSQPDAYRSFPVKLPPLVAPELGPYFEQLAFKHDPKNWYVWREQSPPRGFRGLRQTGRFPGGAFATVRAYEFGHDRSSPRPAVVDQHREGCDADALAADGTLCPSVIAPGVALSEAQALELFTIVNSVEPAPRKTFLFDFDVGFVVFDAEGKPVAEVSVDHAGSKLWSEPQQSRTRADVLDPGRRERMRRLLEALGFRAANSDALEGLRVRQRELDGKAHAVRYLPPSSGVADDLPLDRTTEAQRDRLCAWKELLFREGSPHSDESGGSGFICSDGVDVAARLPKACRSDFPSCSATVGEIEACLRHMRVDGCFKQPNGAACAKLRPCLWGMAWSLSPPQP